jgi:hypothetical protein
MAADKRKTFLDRCIRDKEGHIALWQRPNVPLVVWAVFALLAHLLPGQLQHLAQVVAFAALLLWSLLELFRGVNYARRLLGLVVFIMLMLSTIH